MISKPPTRYAFYHHKPGSCQGKLRTCTDKMGTSPRKMAALNFWTSKMWPPNVRENMANPRFRYPTQRRIKFRLARYTWTLWQTQITKKLAYPTQPAFKNLWQIAWIDFKAKKVVQEQKGGSEWRSHIFFAKNILDGAITKSNSSSISKSGKRAWTGKESKRDKHHVYIFTPCTRTHTHITHTHHTHTHITHTHTLMYIIYIYLFFYICISIYKYTHIFTVERIYIIYIYINM